MRSVMWVCLLGAVAAFPAAAQAADVSVDAGGRLVVTDTLGETNNLVLTVAPVSVSGGTFPPHYFVTDSATQPTTSDTSCQELPGNKVECGFADLTTPLPLAKVVGWTVTTAPPSDTSHNDQVRNQSSLPSVIIGGPGDDVLAGGSGVDAINGGGGRNSLTGGAGGDTIRSNLGSVDGGFDCGSGVDGIYIDANDPNPANCEFVNVGAGNGTLRSDPRVRLGPVTEIGDESARFTGFVNRNGTTGVGYDFEYFNTASGEPLNAFARPITDFSGTPLFGEHRYSAPVFELTPGTPYDVVARATVGSTIIESAQQRFVTKPDAAMAAAGVTTTTVSTTQNGYSAADAGKQKTVTVPVNAPAAGQIQGAVIANVTRLDGDPWRFVLTGGSSAGPSAHTSQSSFFWFGTPTPPANNTYIPLAVNTLAPTRTVPLASWFLGQNTATFGGLSVRTGPYGTISTGFTSCGSSIGGMFSTNAGLTSFAGCSSAGPSVAPDDGASADSSAKKKRRFKRKRVKGFGMYIVIAKGVKTVKRKGRTTLKLKPTRFGKSIFRALRKQVSRRRKKGQKPRRIQLNVDFRFKKKGKRRFTGAQGGQFAIPRPKRP